MLIYYWRKINLVDYFDIINLYIWIKILI